MMNEEFNLSKKICEFEDEVDNANHIHIEECEKSFHEGKKQERSVIIDKIDKWFKSKCKNNGYESIKLGEGIEMCFKTTKLFKFNELDWEALIKEIEKEAKELGIKGIYSDENKSKQIEETESKHIASKETK